MSEAPGRESFTGVDVRVERCHTGRERLWNSFTVPRLKGVFLRLVARNREGPARGALFVGQTANAKAPRRKGSEIVGDSVDSFCQRRNIEVEQQSKRLIQEAQVGQDLGLMNRQHMLHRLELKREFPFNQEVQAISAIQGSPFVDDGD